MKLISKIAPALLILSVFFVGSAYAEGRSGSDIATATCAICHGGAAGMMGIPGAPKTAGEWKARLDAKGGIDGLTASAAAGVGAMPPKGMCSDCSDAELKASVEALIAGAK